MNQPESRIKKTTVNKFCVNNNELLDWCLNNQPDLLSDETIRLLIDNMRITDKQLILRIARKRKFEDILARFFMIPIPVGSVSFNMIRVNDSFCIGEFPVTNLLWETLMPQKTYYKNSDSENCPVTMVNWNDCYDFIEKLNNKIGENFRLPTDDEWYYAAQGGSKSHNYPYSGSDDLDKVAWYDDGRQSELECHPVGKKHPNELGLYDMTGNVWEWVDNGSKIESKLLLGGCYSSSPWFCKLENTRKIDKATAVDHRYGFRLAMDFE